MLQLNRVSWRDGCGDEPIVYNRDDQEGHHSEYYIGPVVSYKVDRNHDDLGDHGDYQEGRQNLCERWGKWWETMWVYLWEVLVAFFKTDFYLAIRLWKHFRWLIFAAFFSNVVKFDSSKFFNLLFHQRSFSLHACLYLLSLAGHWLH